MLARKAAELDRASKIAQLGAENARLRKLASELETDVRELQAALQRPPAVNAAHRLLVVSGGERRARMP